MTPERRRVFVLLGAYEDLTDRETSALRRGDISYVLALQQRKMRLTEALQAARLSAELAVGDTQSLNDRLRILQSRETSNLDALREQMAQVRQSLGELNQAAQRSRKVRRGYTSLGSGMRSTSEPLLGRV